MENKALLWFKPDKIGWLLLQRGMLEEQQWKKIHCMIKGNNLFYILKLNRPEPQGVLPLEGCVAEISHENNDGPTIYRFIITMKKPIFQDSIRIRSSYVFATKSIEDCQCWVDAINMAAIPTHIARLKLEFAKQEVEELIIRLTNLQDKDAQRLKDKDFKVKQEEEEDPYVLQALANQLMELYHSMVLAEDSKVAAQKQIYTTRRYIAKLQEAINMLEESVEENIKTLIQNDVNMVKEKLKHVISLRCSLRDVAKEIEVLNGNHEYGPQVQVMTTRKSILLNTLKKIRRLREEKILFERNSNSSNEGELLELCNKVNSIYESERILLQKALPEENVEISAQQGRHYFCSLASYALVPILENHTKRKQDSQPTSELEETSTKWWNIKRFLNLFCCKKSKGNVQSNRVLSELGNERKKSENQLFMHSGSILLPHLQMGLKENASSNSLLKSIDARGNEHDRDSLFSSTNEIHGKARESEKDDKNIDEDIDSFFSFPNDNYSRTKKDKKDSNFFEEQKNSSLLQIRRYSESEKNENNNKNIEEEINPLLNSDGDIHIMSIGKNN